MAHKRNTYTIKINTGNDAFHVGDEWAAEMELAGILRELALRLERVAGMRLIDRAYLKDSNGNTVGYAEWTTK